MKRYQGYWAAEHTMTPKAFCHRMGHAECIHHDDGAYEVRVSFGGGMAAVICTSNSAQAAWRKAADEIDASE